LWIWFVCCFFDVFFFFFFFLFCFVFLCVVEIGSQRAGKGVKMMMTKKKKDERKD